MDERIDEKNSRRRGVNHVSRKSIIIVVVVVVAVVGARDKT